MCVCAKKKKEMTSSSDLSAGSLTGVVWCVWERERKRRSVKEGSEDKPIFTTLKCPKWCKPPQRIDLQSVYNVESPSCVNRTWTLNSICNIDSQLNENGPQNQAGESVKFLFA